MAVGDVQQISAVWEVNGVTAMNSWYWEETTAPTPPSTTDLIVEWESTILPLIQAFQSEECVLSCLIRKVIFPMEQPAVPAFRSLPGLVLQDSLPANSHVCVSWYGIDPSGINPTRVRNSSLVPGIPETFHEKNTLVDDAVALIDTWRGAQNDVLVSANGGNYLPVVRKNVLGPGPPFTFWPLDRGLTRPTVRVTTRRNSVLCNPV